MVEWLAKYISKHLFIVKTSHIDHFLGCEKWQPGLLTSLISYEPIYNPLFWNVEIPKKYYKDLCEDFPTVETIVGTTVFHKPHHLDAALDAVLNYWRGRLHTFLNTSKVLYETDGPLWMALVS
jgi:hypothetical protein